MKKLTTYRFLVLRRITQLSILTLFIGGNYFGWNILKGNYSSAELLQYIPFSDPYAIVQLLAAGHLAAGKALVGGLIIFILYALLGGRTFCSWVCPLNILMDTANAIRSKLNPENSNRLKLNRRTRYFVLLIGIILSFILGYAAFEAVSPISLLHRGIVYGFGFGWVVILALMLFDITLLKHGWCGHICPLGAFYALVGKFGLFRVKYIHEKCTECMRCIEKCPESQVLSMVTVRNGLVKSGECSNCGKCVEVCDDNALKFAINNYKRNKDGW